MCLVLPSRGSSKPPIRLNHFEGRRRKGTSRRTVRKHEHRWRTIFVLRAARKWKNLSVSSTRITDFETTSGEGGTAHTGQNMNVWRQKNNNVCLPRRRSWGWRAYTWCIWYSLRLPWLDVRTGKCSEDRGWKIAACGGLKPQQLDCCRHTQTRTTQLGNKATPNSSLPSSFPSLRPSVRFALPPYPSKAYFSANFLYDPSK